MTGRHKRPARWPYMLLYAAMLIVIVIGAYITVEGIIGLVSGVCR